MAPSPRNGGPGAPGGSRFVPGVNPGELYSVEMDSRTPVSTLCVFFQNGFAESVYASMVRDDVENQFEPLPFLGGLHFREGSILPRMQANADSGTCDRLWLDEQFLLLAHDLLELNGEMRKRAALMPANRPPLARNYSAACAANRSIVTPAPHPTPIWPESRARRPFRLTTFTAPSRARSGRLRINIAIACGWTGRAACWKQAVDGDRDRRRGGIRKSRIFQRAFSESVRRTAFRIASAKNKQDSIRPGSKFQPY
jgi:hypothetical protein